MRRAALAGLSDDVGKNDEDRSTADSNFSPKKRYCRKCLFRQKNLHPDDAQKNRRSGKASPVQTDLYPCAGGAASGCGRAMDKWQCAAAKNRFSLRSPFELGFY